MQIKVAFASGTDELNVRLVERMRRVFPELPLYVVSEFPPADREARWIPYRNQSLWENWQRCRAAFRGKSIRLAGVLLVPKVPFRRMRVMAFALAPLYFLAINENFNEFMLRPRSIPTMARHLWWRAGNLLRWYVGPAGVLRHRDWGADFWYLAARAAALLRRKPQQLDPESAARFVRAEMGDTEKLEFLARQVGGRRFRDHWKQTTRGLRGRAALRQAARIALRRGARTPARGADTNLAAEDLIFALADGSVTIHPGRAASGKPRVLIASAYVPFPLSHGGAVRIDNLTRRAAAEFDQVLAAFTDDDRPPAPELLERFVEVVLVRRQGSHSVRAKGRPDVVAQFGSTAFREALRLSVRKWRPGVAQLEFTQMAQYAADCAPARTILVEHDITFDLYNQLASLDGDWDIGRQVKRWRRFETAAWKQMDRVVTMSERDRAMISGAPAVTLPNGVDLDRFRAAASPPEPGRLLFVGSFSHLPNLLAVEFFLKQVWPRLRNARLHIIAGARHEYYLEYYRGRVAAPVDQAGVELDGFVADVRPAYERAAVVVAPLVASAGTNLKILEAMACGRPVVSTPEGVHGLDLEPEDFVLARSAEEMAAAIERLLEDSLECQRLARAGRRRVEQRYGWDGIARRQAEIYRELMGKQPR